MQRFCILYKEVYILLGLQTVNIQKGGRETHTRHCLAKTNGTFTTNRCEALKMYTCDGGRYFNLHFRRIKLKH